MNYLILLFSGLQELVGIIVGHTYFFLMYKYPQEMGGPQLIQTPQILLVFLLDLLLLFVEKVTNNIIFYLCIIL